MSIYLYIIFTDLAYLFIFLMLTVIASKFSMTIFNNYIIRIIMIKIYSNKIYL